MNISQHCFVPLAFKEGHYTDRKGFTVDQYGSHCSDLFHIANCNSCILYRQVGVSLTYVGGIFRGFIGDTLSFKSTVIQVSQFPYTLNFTPASDMELSLSYGIPVGMVDFLVYDDPDVQPTRMMLGDTFTPDDIDNEEEIK